MENIHRKVDYVPGSTDIETTAEAALEAGKGVCQDHAHILISRRPADGPAGPFMFPVI